MSRQSAERFLPESLLAKASLRGKEYAWTVDDIPSVIEAARNAGLVSLGGQLQFRLSDGGTCECYWVDVDTGKTIPDTLPWPERVERSADAALNDFAALRLKFDFIAEGRKAFAGHFDEMAAQGDDPAARMCFVWYVLDKNEADTH